MSAKLEHSEDRMAGDRLDLDVNELLREARHIAAKLRCEAEGHRRAHPGGSLPDAAFQAIAAMERLGNALAEQVRLSDRVAARQTEGLHPSASDSPPPHPEDFCERCRRPNVVWFAPNHVWNIAVPEGGILCPVCFVQSAERAGITPPAWEVRPEVLERARAVPDPREAAPEPSEAAIEAAWTSLLTTDSPFRHDVHDALCAAYRAQFGAGDSGAPHPEPAP